MTSVLILVPVVAILVSTAQNCAAQLAPFAELSVPVGVETDPAGNVYVSHDAVTATYVSKFSPNATFIGSAQIGGFFDIGALGALRRIPSTGTLLHLLKDGTLLAIDPANLTATTVLSLRSVPAAVNAIYDIFTRTTGSFGGTIQTAQATYGDFALHETSEGLELFVAGLSQASTFPFLMRVRLQGQHVTDARVLISSSAETVTDSLQAQRLTRGVAVNAQGTVLTTLPFVTLDDEAVPTSERAYDVAVAFPVSFEPADGVAPAETPQLVLGPSVDVYSQGMTTDAAGRFYVVTNSVGTAALGIPGEGALLVFPPALNRLIGTARLNEALTSFRDVAVTPDADRLYITVERFSVGPAPDLVVSAPLASVVATKAAPSSSRVDGFLGLPYPHPFANRATVAFSAPVSEQTRLEMHDVLGRSLGILYEGTPPAGTVIKAEIDGSQFPAGAYTLRLTGESFARSRTIVLIR